MGSIPFFRSLLTYHSCDGSEFCRSGNRTYESRKTGRMGHSFTPIRSGQAHAETQYLACRRCSVISQCEMHNA